MALAVLAVDEAASVGNGAGTDEQAPSLVLAAVESAGVDAHGVDYWWEKRKKEGYGCRV